MSRDKRNKVAKILDNSARQRGIDRAKHFASGGTVESWRGRHSVTKDARKETARKKCRGKVDSE